MVTYELESCTLGLLLTTELEAREMRLIGAIIALRNMTYCLHRLSDICILYLQTVHSSRSTIFLVVFACYPMQNKVISILIVAQSLITHLLVEDGLGLTTVTGLLAHVTTLSLDDLRILALLVLRHLVGAK